MNSDQSRRSFALRIETAQHGPRTLGRYHTDIDVSRGHDLPIVYVKSVSEHQGLACRQPLFDELAIDRRVQIVRNKHYDYVCRLGYLVSRGHLESGLLGLLPRLTLRCFGYHHRATTILKVVGMGISLTAVANNANCLTL